MKISKNNFRLPCTNQIMKDLGEADAIAESSYLALHYFLNEYQNDPDILKDYSNKYHIRVDNIQDQKFLSLNCMFYIVSTFQQFENFLIKFYKSHPLSNQWDDSISKNKLYRILYNLDHNHKKIKSTIGEVEIDLYNYYRHIRNKFIHSLEEDFQNYDELKNKVKANDEYSDFEAPNLFENISIEDFMLFTRAMKRLAINLSLHSKPTDAELAEFAYSNIINNESSINVTKLKKLFSNQKKLETKISYWIQNEYGIEVNDSHFIVESIIKDLLA